jgi:hypothetical protein
MQRGLGPPNERAFFYAEGSGLPREVLVDALLRKGRNAGFQITRVIFPSFLGCARGLRLRARAGLECVGRRQQPGDRRLRLDCLPGLGGFELANVILNNSL